ncbi:MAG TPA: adenylate/guanylate cyclase domain-containing protein [Methylophilaceae bacterium]|nr:adenylate/guanylate cyclase domain-containing protein [Methylophilaceae bacterium]
MSLRAFIARHAIRIGLSLVVLAMLLLNTIGILPIGFIQGLENYTYDVRLNLMMPRTLDERIVIVDIDEKSLREQGHWPWGRHKLAQLVDKLFDDYQVNTLGFDVVFAEKDESSGLGSLERIAANFPSNAVFQQALAELKPRLNYDQLFASSLGNRNVVLGYYFHQEEHAASVGMLPAPSFTADAGLAAMFHQATGYGANLQVLQENAATAGHFNPAPDADGISRRVPALISFKGNVYEALSLAVARVALGARLETGIAAGLWVNDQYAGLEWLMLGGRRIPVDSEVSVLVPYRGGQGSFLYVSATDVLNGKVAHEKLKDRIVLVGTTAPGLMDLRATPVQHIYPGVEVHANVIAGILDQNIKERPAYVLGAEFLILMLTGLLLAFLLPALSPVWATVLASAMLVSGVAFNLLLWESANLVLPLASFLLLIAIVYVLNMSYGFFIESRGKRQLAGLFGQYVPPELVDEMARDPSAFSLEGESREMTVLFSDVRGFTTISEGLDPKQLTQLMNEFLTPMTHIIHHTRGTIDKYMGDAIMAFWGAPLHDPGHARHALLAAMQMVHALTDLQARFEEKGWPEINIGVGLNTGLMTVGNMGSEFRMAYTVMGDAVNLGSRLEGLTKNYGVHIIVSEFTRAQAPDFIFRELDVVRVKGKDKPVTIYEPVCETSQLEATLQDELRLYTDALERYRRQDWDGASKQFLDLQKHYPQRYLYQMYSERIAYFRQHAPGENWDGVFTYETK